MTTVPMFVSTEWLAANLDDPQVMVLEVAVRYSGSGEPTVDERPYREVGHIPGARFVNLARVNAPNAPIPFTLPKDLTVFYRELESLGIHAGARVVVYDRGALWDSPQAHADMWAARFAWQCHVAGLENISVLDGGWFKWQLENRPTTREMPTVTPSALGHLMPHWEAYADQESVIKSLAGSQSELVDALSPEQYAGVSCPFGEARAGHIPGAKNLFFLTLTDAETGARLPAEQLTERLQQIGLTDPAKPVTIYCGFGIAASYLYCVLKALSYQQVSVYDGSLMEWAQFTTQPLESAL